MFISRKKLAELGFKLSEAELRLSEAERRIRLFEARQEGYNGRATETTRTMELLLTLLGVERVPPSKGGLVRKGKKNV